MIKELKIKNFQIFENLTVDGLKKVNLIAGKNNTGKSTLLDGLRILQSKGDNTVINNILQSRGQFEQSWDSSFNALFNQKILTKNKTEQDGFGKLLINDFFLWKRTETNPIPSFEIGATNLPNTISKLNANVTPDNPKDIAIFIPFTENMDQATHLWQKISLTPLEDDVIKILQDTVEPKLLRLNISLGTTKVRLEGYNSPVPLQSLGEGVKRVLLIAIGLVSAKDNILLIDEFEAGLHHSVQEKLWEMIFHYAQKWNIQVFATTHSEDTVKNFYYVGSKPENAGDALFLRLQNSREGSIEAITYDMERLGNALELHLETR
ncbi:MAG TPA: AAA family ATPase [Flavilitoribacter sp.]|nr:AAA family ATPase [Flavilitoribacter sp.]HMQ87981.1 AAA family ATPase [Flavilitoribacter sp.]